MTVRTGPTGDSGWKPGQVLGTVRIGRFAGAEAPPVGGGGWEHEVAGQAQSSGWRNRVGSWLLSVNVTADVMGCW